MSFRFPYSCQEKPRITYPCNWLYKIIGEEKEAVRKAVFHICQGRDFSFTNSRTSSGGRYKSFNLKMEVESDEARLSIYARLSNHPHIKMVI